MLFHGLTPAEAAQRLNDARERLADRRLINRKTDEPFGVVTFSGGVADLFGYPDPRTALQAADEALYPPQAGGRSPKRVVVGKGASGSVASGGCRLITKKKNKH